MRHFEADVEQANQKLKSAAVAIAVAGAIMGMLLLSAWWLTGGNTKAIGQGSQLGRIFEAARNYAVNTGEGYPQRMTDLLRDGYLSPDVFGLTDDWQAAVDAARTSLPAGTRLEVIGDFRFAPLDEPTRLEVIIFGWVRHDESNFSLLYDDGHFVAIHGDPSAAFEKDAEERRKRGLPLYEWDAVP